MRRIALLISALSILAGCAAKHYVVCVQGSQGAGCSHQQYTFAESRRVAALLATMPIAEDVTVWVERKGASVVAPVAPAVEIPQPKSNKL